jgi:hypothetical protein
MLAAIHNSRVSILYIGQQLCPFEHAKYPAPEQIPRGPYVSGIDIGLRQHVPAEQHRNLMRIDRIVFGLAPVDRLHVEGLAQDEGNTFQGPELGGPGPRVKRPSTQTARSSW